jgi:hypothetical protein
MYSHAVRDTPSTLRQMIATVEEFNPIVPSDTSAILATATAVVCGRKLTSDAATADHHVELRMLVSRKCRRACHQNKWSTCDECEHGL